MSTTLPNVMSRYLLMMAAIISVPPVLPFAEKATPIPPPQKDAPMTHAIKAGREGVRNLLSAFE